MFVLSFFFFFLLCERETDLSQVSVYIGVNENRIAKWRIAWLFSGKLENAIFHATYYLRSYIFSSSPFTAQKKQEILRKLNLILDRKSETKTSQLSVQCSMRRKFIIIVDIIVNIEIGTCSRPFSNYRWYERWSVSCRRHTRFPANPLFSLDSFFDEKVRDKWNLGSANVVRWYPWQRIPRYQRSRIFIVTWK